MSSSQSRGQKSANKKVSSDDLESVAESDEELSSVIRLPHATVFSAVTNHLPGAPPPLPPKPAFARTSNVGTGPPPPLPPKPESARAEKVVDALSAFFQDSDLGDLGLCHLPLPGPTKPLPPIPKYDRKPSVGEDESWVPCLLDDRSQIDPPVPPEPTIISEGDLMRNSIGRDALEVHTHSLSGQLPNLTIPLPPPPYVSSNFQAGSILQPLATERNDSKPPQGTLFLSAEAVEDSHIGAIVLSRRKLQSKHIGPHPRPAPVSWRLYRASEPGGEAWSVLHEYLTNVSLKTRGRNRALRLLTGYVVGACLESTEAGMNLLTEIVRRMRGAERSERDGSIFTLLINVGAHCSFVHRVSWASVEEVTRRVFSDVVEEMHGRQDDDVMWERALRCYLVLLKSTDCRPSDDISSRCLAALALHLGDLTHTDVDHVLISEGLCPRLRSNCDDFPTSARVDVRLLEEIGGIETILTLFADTASPSARHSLFAVIYDIVVLQCLEDTPQETIAILNDHVLTLRALLETYEIAELLIHTFRVGPWQNFVMDTITLLLFYPLSEHAADVLMGKGTGNGKLGEKVFQEKSESLSIDGTRVTGTTERQLRSATAKYLASTRALVKMLDKSFCLKVILQMERMAKQHSSTVAHRESMHFAREWKILSDMESNLQRYLFSRGGNLSNALSDILTKMYVAVVDITSGRSNTKSILTMIEMVIEFFTSTAPFAEGHDPKSTAPDSIAQKFLNGQISVSRELIQKADRSIFTLLLLASKSKTTARRISESRQCLVEFLGASTDALELLKPFADDDDATVAYRVQEIVSKYAENSLQPSTPQSVTVHDG